MLITGITRRLPRYSIRSIKSTSYRSLSEEPLYSSTRLAAHPLWVCCKSSVLSKISTVLKTAVPLGHRWNGLKPKKGLIKFVVGESRLKFHIELQLACFRLISHIQQLLAIWKKAKSKERDVLLWGDEVQPVYETLDSMTAKMHDRLNTSS